MIEVIRGLRSCALFAIVAACLLTVACKDDPNTGGYGDDDDDFQAGDAQHGEECDDTDDCAPGLICAGNGTCLYPGEPGTAAEGDPCISTEYCQAGLVCDHDGECAETGAPGTSGEGEFCEESEDCQLMMECIEGACYGFQVPLWFGVPCQDEEQETGPFRVYFEVPGDDPLSEFYRLPFPNDARIIDGEIDLSGHATPGNLIPMLGDVTASIIEVIEEDLTAWGNNQAVFMRFSGRPDYDTMTLDDPGIGAVYTVDITEGTDEYGTRHSGGYRAAGTRQNYICSNWISFDNSDGRPYLPGHTYASVITTQVLERDTATPVVQDADFTEVLSATPPSDGRLQRAWEAYEPFRAWLADAGFETSTIAGAAVFTVQDPREEARALRDAVRATDAPVVSGAHLCESGTPGPYATADDERRGCDGVNANYHEIQGLVSLPAFQTGSPPFKTAADGGALNMVGGVPVPVGTEDVVFSLTVPKGAAMPAEGWPIVIYGHGTGGLYRSAVNNDIAEVLADVGLDDGSHVRFATLGIDAVVHGPRRHEENWDDAWLEVDPGAYDSDVLFFNVLNPRAARDNPLQAAADGYALVRMIEDLDWDAGTSVTGDAVQFDLDNIYYMGHSQGSTTGVAFAAYEPMLKGVVFSGAGGLLIESMLNKRNPYDLPAAIQVGLAEPVIDRWHPVLNLVQALAERSDGVNHAAYVLREPVENNGPRHVFQSYGIGDSYTPDQTQWALARAMRLDQVTNGNEPVQYLTEEVPPVSGNHWVNSTAVTGVVALYQPNAENDGHYVIFDLANAQRQYSHFLGTAVTEDEPIVVVP